MFDEFETESVFVTKRQYISDDMLQVSDDKKMLKKLYKIARAQILEAIEKSGGELDGTIMVTLELDATVTKKL